MRVARLVWLWLIVAGLVSAAIPFATPAAEPVPGADAVAANEAAPAVGEKTPVDFIRDIRPILLEHCEHCHNAEKQLSGLRLDSAAAILNGGNRGASFVAGKSADSRLVQALLGKNGIPRMPADADPLPDDVVAKVAAWIDAGAALPADAAASTDATSAKPSHSDHWSFQPIADVTPPAVSMPQWVRNPIDAFILAALDRASLKPSPEADRATLLRRVSLDLTGLPPSPAELDSFLTDNRADAYEHAVDRLLASPHYAERWGRHWLDLARYADSNGYTIDSGRSIWKYRDWVLAALNADMPFDRFVIEQLAGDLLPDPTLDQRIATGFHRNTLKNEEGGTDPEQFRTEAVVDRVSTTGAVFLGLTVGCARCHDHKYDPISQREFYQLFAIFNDADEITLNVPTDQQAKELPALEAEIAQMTTRLKDLDANSGTRQLEWETLFASLAVETPENKTDARRQSVPEPILALLVIPAADRNDEQKKQIVEEFHKHDKERLPLAKSLDDLQDRHKQLKSSITTTLVVQPRQEPRQTTIHLRGDFLRPGITVEPAVPAILPSMTAASARPTRLDFARWLVELRSDGKGPQNPLVARVTVNRIWQQYFGRGLVMTENDFGTQGDQPTHPELLDWLARAFSGNGWSQKKFHRLIVTSATYRQASTWRSDLMEVDAGNKLLARQARLRLEAEIVRDAALAASGLLARELGGPSVYPPQPQGIYAFTQQKKYWKESEGADRYRRTMYTYFWRSSPYPFLTTLDAPDANVSCTRRVRSNTPLQALTLANDRGYFELAQGLAVRVLREVPGSGDAQRIAGTNADAVTAAPNTPVAAADPALDLRRLRHAVRLSLAREPAPPELTRLSTWLTQEREHFAHDTKSAESVAGSEHLDGSTPPAELAAWTSVARVLLNVDEFVTRE